jgi:hypothetical protein
VTAFLSRRLAPLSALLDGPPEGAEPQAFDPSVDGEALAWLGFERGEPQEPLLRWSRPQRWPAARRPAGGRHRATARLRTA